MLYVSLSVVTVIVRKVLETPCEQQDSAALESMDVPSPRRPLRRFLNAPVVRFTAFLLLGSFFLPVDPWRNMTTAPLYDLFIVISSGVTVVVPASIPDLPLQEVKLESAHTHPQGSNPLGNFNYNRLDDPYYISNLDSPVDGFVAKALEGTHFTNIVHIVLESMRADSYPFKEDSLLATYIRDNFEPAPNGKAVTTANVSPFIASLAEHSISWETVWSSVPFTHKAMLGRK